MHCSEPSHQDFDGSADDLEDPAGHVPAAGPHADMLEPADQPDMEDVGALADDVQDADLEEEHHQQAGEYCCHPTLASSALTPFCTDVLAMAPLRGNHDL